MFSDRINQILSHAKMIREQYIENHFQYDKLHAAANQYKNMETWEKIAYSTAYAIENQDVVIVPFDKLIGRINQCVNKPPEASVADLDHHTEPYHKCCEEIQGYQELSEYQLCFGSSVGHIAWHWNKILTLGTEGVKKLYQDALETAADERAKQFYSGVLIELSALENWNDKHVSQLKKLGNNELAALCEKVPRYPVQTFHEALQSFYIQYLVVMSENPYGGNSPGRLDYYLWPYLESDLKNDICSMEQASELIEELFIRLDERIHSMDGWVESITVGGSYPNGCSAVNPLSYIMIESFMKLNLTHPAVYIRFPDNPPEDFLKLCVKYYKAGSNRAQLLSDRAIIKALVRNGVAAEDATNFVCGGCMEIGIQGMSSDFIFQGFQNIPKMLELFITGGECLNTHQKVTAFRAKGLEQYTDFACFYQDFIVEARRIIHMFLQAQDIFSETADKARPAYLISSMIDDCLPRGRNMHGGGARYHYYGGTPMGLPNVVDALFAIKKAVFDDKICTAHELLTAIKANFEGHEQLRRRLQMLAKYGQQNEEADEMAKMLMTDICNSYSLYRNRLGGRGMAVILTFVWATTAGSILGASADGNYAGKPVAHGITPQSSSMSKGITCAMNSCTSVPSEVFSGGASTMWDLDESLASDAVIEALILTFIKSGGQIYQGNTTNVEQLREAQKHPEDNYHLIVRVGGFSARFVLLSEDIQNEIIGRCRHKG